MLYDQIVEFGPSTSSPAGTIRTTVRLFAVFPRFLTHFVELFPTLATMRLVGRRLQERASVRLEICVLAPLDGTLVRLTN